MDTVGVRELADHASAVLGEVERTGEPVIVTNRGRPAAVLSAIDQDALEDYILMAAPVFVQGRREAEKRYARGERGRSLIEVTAELESEERGRGKRA